MSALNLMRLLGDIGMTAFAIVMLFVELANYLLDRHKRHWMAMAILFLFAVIFSVRALSDANLMTEETARNVLGILWFVNLLLCIAWGGMILIAKWKLALQTKRYIRENEGNGTDQGH